MDTPSGPIIGASGPFRLGFPRLDVNGVAMRVLTAVWAVLLAVAWGVAWGSTAALAQSDGRESYGPVSATRAKPNAAPKPAPKPAAQPAAVQPAVAQPAAAKPAA